ncbi:hypothetical protein BN1080_00605 [Planococcus massiliensis]|uniref:Uncharacterized protein n=1 Tax=Planococcus massiliensis TaxID=1499687 RepID=A0A098EKT0_9BACL|nr:MULTISPECIES: hypothetical protein [Planococcus]MCJ1907935.1 hypothetical protein [Planococcus ruber]CEG21691.1 hypothetical protein BN1080_00605 [Planococcus massiliensis]
MEKDQREHEKKMKDMEHEKRESGNNRYAAEEEEKNSITERGQPEQNPTDQNSSGKASNDSVNAGGNDSDYDGGHPTDVSPEKR